MRGSTVLLQAIPALLPLLATFLTRTPVVLAGSQKIGQNCSTSDSRLESGTFAFFDDCDVHAFCNDTTNLCEKKRCRRDVFPFGYNISENLPDLCDRGTFCPDEQSHCIALLPVGSACQLNRDDMCEPPPNFAELRDEQHRGLNVNGSVCLNNKCMWANATVGQECVIENTAYIAYEPNGDEYINIVSRGNCKVGLWCDAQSLKCQNMKALGESCDADKECSSFNCGSDGKCGKDAALPVEVGTWVYIVVAVCIFVGMVGTLVGLFFVHKKNRDAEREKRVQYWREQHAFRQNLLQMQETAKQTAIGHGSIRSTTYSQRDSEDAYGPGAHKQAASGLRNAFSEDGESDDGQITYDPARNRF